MSLREKLSKYGLSVSVTPEGKTRVEGLNSLSPSHRGEVLALIKEEIELQQNIALVHSYLPEPPLIAPDMPAWELFCSTYPRCEVDGVQCCYYTPERLCWCQLWEACFPGAVRWYPLEPLAIAGEGV